MILTCGLDEVGRGALAGPLFGCGFVSFVPIDQIITRSPAPVRDSKTLSKRQREKIFVYLTTLPILFKVETISVSDINLYGIAWANQQLFLRLIKSLSANRYYVDGNQKLFLPGKQITSIVDGDAKYPEISLASIIAKIYRDDYMSHLHQFHPQYSWDSNKGYGTSLHTQALAKHGATVHHRHQFVSHFLI